MDLAAYADLAIRLVNTGTPDNDRLLDLNALRALLAMPPYLTGRVGRPDLDVMRELREDLREIFEAVARGEETEAVELLNGLLIRHPVHPQISGHDGEPWHLHITESGSIPDRYAAGAAMGLAVFVSAEGIERLAVCESPPCRNVFFDTSSNRSRRYCSDKCAADNEVVDQRGLNLSEGLGQ